MHLRHIETAPTFMRQEYDTAQEWSWAFGGFNFPRASFYPEGRRTGEAVGQFCGSSLACVSSKGSFWQMILERVPALIFFRACAHAFAGFPRVDDDVVIDALAVIEKLPDRHRVQQVMHGVPWQHEIWQCC